MSRSLGIITESGKAIGYGHLYRSIAIAESFLSKGYGVTFYSNENVNDLLNKKIPGVSVNKWNVIDVEFQNHDFIAFDVYKDSLSKFRRIVDKCETCKVTTITVIDYAFNEYALSTDYVFHVGYQKYKEKIQLLITNKRYTWVYSGTDFLTFRKEFMKTKTHEVASTAKKILVTMGGSDPSKLTECVFDSLKTYPKPLEITYIVGNGFEKARLNNLKISQNDTKHSIKVLQQVDNMSEIMIEHDIAIINGGNTRFELAALGIPFISIAMNRKQKMISDKIAEDGIGISLEEINKFDSIHLSESLRLLLEDNNYRKAMSVKMTSIFNANASYGKIAKALDRNLEFRKLKDSELEHAYWLHCEVVDYMLGKGIRQWLRPIDFMKLKKRQNKSENFGLFIDDEMQVFLSLTDRMDYHEWTKEMPSQSTIWLNTVSVNVDNSIKGLGKVAIQFAIEHLRTTETKELYLDCVVNDGFLLEYYKDLGFIKLSEKLVKYRSGDFRVALMKKKLT